MLVDIAAVDRTFGRVLPDGRQDGTKDFFAKEDESSHGPDGRRRNMIATGFCDLANELFAA